MCLRERDLLLWYIHILTIARCDLVASSIVSVLDFKQLHHSVQQTMDYLRIT